MDTHAHTLSLIIVDNQVSERKSLMHVLSRTEHDCITIHRNKFNIIANYKSYMKFKKMKNYWVLYLHKKSAFFFFFYSNRFFNVYTEEKIHKIISRLMNCRFLCLLNIQVSFLLKKKNHFEWRLFAS